MEKMPKFNNRRASYKGGHKDWKKILINKRRELDIILEFQKLKLNIPIK